MRKIAMIMMSAMLLAGLKPLMAQDCVSYYPLKSGMVTEMTTYDGKNKVTGMNRTTVLSNTANATGYVVNIKSESFDASNVSTGGGEYSYSCANGTFVMSMKNLFDPKNMAAYEGMELTIDATDIDMPSSPVAGQTLKDGSFSMKVVSGGFPVMNMKVRMYNRKVEGIESITTPAGTFECVKISYDLDNETMFKITTKGVDWYAKEVGAVKSESYDSKGKLLGSSVLTKIVR